MNTSNRPAPILAIALALLLSPPPLQAAEGVRRNAAEPVRKKATATKAQTTARKTGNAAAGKRSFDAARTGHKSKAGALPGAAQAGAEPFAMDREDIRGFVEAMVERHGFDRDALTRTLGEARRIPAVLRLIAPPAPTFKRSWEAYRARFLDPLRVREGLRFWQTHEAALVRAQQTWQVPPEIVVAIIGVETIYGRMTGDFRVIDALATLAFDYPRRADFFRDELEQYLLFARDEQADVFGVRGSFAGAIGLPQFMPGSIRRHATDFDGDGRIDLRSSPVDAIGSVARFLARHGWIGGEPTHFPIDVREPASIPRLIEAGIEPRFLPAELEALGIGSPQAIPPEMPLALIDLPNADRPPTYLLGARNFYVITRYNRSSFYAMAVIELANVLAASR